jgi:hypothetical protein
MIRYITLATALVACCAAPAVFAASEAVPLPQVEVLTHRPPALSSAEFDALRGSYQLDNGAVLHVAGPHGRPVAEIDEGGPTLLQAITPNQLASADGRLRIDFLAAANGTVSAVAVTMSRPAP